MIVAEVENYLKPNAKYTSKQRVLAGFSNGGAWSLSFAIENPEFANLVIALSPGGPVVTIPNPERHEHSNFVIGFGEKEVAFSAHAKK